MPRYENLTQTFLSEDELRDLTHLQMPAAQAKALSAMGIIHVRRPNGSVAVLRSHVEEVLGGKSATPLQPVSPEPNWAAMEEWHNELEAKRLAAKSKREEKARIAAEKNAAREAPKPAS